VQEEGFAGGAGFYLWSLVKLVPGLADLPDAIYLGATVVILAALAAGLTFRRGGFDGSAHGAALIAGIVMLLWSPHYAWYFAWLVVFACLVPSAALLWLTLASFLLYLVPVGSQLVRDPYRLFVESVLYLPFIVLAATELWRHRRREQPRHDDDASS
jgi:alpha-1,6-mannosyltransferase